MKINGKKSHSTSEIKAHRRDSLRRLLSILLLFVTAVPMMGGGVQALWVIPSAICISMNEGVYFSMFAGVLAGILMDYATGGILCANAMFLACCCTFVSLLFTDLFRRTFLNYYLVMMICVIGRAGISYFLTQVLFEEAGREILWAEVALPSCILTLIAAVLVYWIYLPMGKLMNRQVKSMDAAAIYRET